MNLENVRNIGIIAHIDAGKTTTTERILFLAGRIRRIGNVDDGNTTTDYMDQERERGITIVSASTAFDWMNTRINLIDTPGHVDFTAEVERSLRVLDGVIIVLCGVAGVQPQTETVWRQANRYEVPRLIYVNKLDRMGSNLDNVVGKIRQRLGAKPAVLHVPIGSEDRFIGFVDLITEKAYVWPTVTDGTNMEIQEIPSEIADEVKLRKFQLIETVAESDEEALSIFINKGTLTDEEIIKFLRQATLKNKLVPVLCGSSFRHRGIQPLLDSVVSFLPSPLEKPPIIGHHPRSGQELTRTPDSKGPTTALVFKVISDAYLGSLSFVRVYSGSVKASSYLVDAATGKKERIMRCLHLLADQREDVDELLAGDIGGILGLKEATTGHTLHDEAHPITLEPIKFPDTVISMAVEPQTKAEGDKLNKALRRLSLEDPTFQVRFDEESSETIISGMGELHLEVMIERVRRENGLQLRVGRPQVAYRETIGKSVTVRGKQVKQTGGQGQYGDVLIRVEPAQRSLGLIFENQTSDQVLPRQFEKAIEQGIRDAMEVGPMIGYPVADIKVTVLDGSYHEVDSSEIAFRIAASKGLKEALRKGDPQLLEPIMKLQVITPEEYLGDVLAHLNKSRCKIEKMDQQGTSQIIEALAPLAEMFGYATDLRSISKGRAAYTMEFSHLEITPQHVKDAVVLAVRGIPWTTQL